MLKRNVLSDFRFSENRKVLLKVPKEAQERVVLPSYVTDIGKEAFAGCTNIEAITFEGKIFSIGDRAFSGCVGLSAFHLPVNLSRLGEGAFENCSGLMSIIIPDSLKEIESATFRSCHALRYIALSHSIESIAGNAFVDCSNLVRIFVPKGCLGKFSKFDGLKAHVGKIVEEPNDYIDPMYYESETIITIMKANGIQSLYHFTAKKNLPLIKKEGGLFSTTQLWGRDINPEHRGGSASSVNSDWGKDITKYVHLSFCKEHPMSYHVRKRGEQVVVLEVSLDVIDYALHQLSYEPTILFSNVNAIKAGAKIQYGLEGLLNVNFEATKTDYLKNTDPLFPYKQAEVMIEKCVPMKFINPNPVLELDAIEP